MHIILTLLLPATLTVAINLSFVCKPGNPGAVYTCTGPHFRGTCSYRLPNDEYFVPDTAPQSIEPDKGGYCVLFEDRECKGDMVRDGKADGIK